MLQISKAAIKKKAEIQTSGFLFYDLLMLTEENVGSLQ